MTRRTLLFQIADGGRLRPLDVRLGPEQPIARGVPWPYLVQLRDGTTIVLAHVSWPKGGKYPIHYTAVSRDGRKTWQEWKPGAGQGAGPITEGTSVELRDGTLLVFNVHVEHQSNKLFETDFWSTRDSYRTLAGPRKFRFTIPEAETQGKDDRGEVISRIYFRRSVIELAGGDLLACAYGRFESDQAPVEYLGAMTKMRSFLLRSSDRGANWRYVSTIAADPVEQEGPAEPAIVQLTRGPLKGRIICVVRTGRENPIYQCESDDEGRTWTRAYPLSWQYSRFGRRRELAGTDPDLIEMSDGTLAMSYGHKPDYEDHGNFVAFSTDQGRSWIQQTRLSSSVTMAYTGVREVAPGELFVVAHPRHLESSTRWVAEARSNPAIVGVKLHPVLGQWDILSAAACKLMDEVIAPAGLTVLSHVGNESPLVPIDKYLRLAERYPGVRFIAAHLGTGIMGLSDSSIDAWRDRPLANVWFDMGTLRAFHTGAVEAVVAAVGPDRVCFGTDAPLYPPAPFVRLLETLELPDAVKAKIASENVLAAIPQLQGRLSP